MIDGFIDYDDEGRAIVECWQCNGEGTIAHCFEEFACCDPDEGCDYCASRCDICRGKGSYAVPAVGTVNDSERS